MNNSAITLTGINGANPLGYLTALGTLVVLQSSYPGARLSWRRSVAWVPVLDCREQDQKVLCQTLAAALLGSKVTSEAEEKRVQTQLEFDSARKAVTEKHKEIKSRKLRGKERAAVIEAEVIPLEADANRKRGAWLESLKHAVPRPELALGKHINPTVGEFRDYAEGFLESASHMNRDTVDLLASFGEDISPVREQRISATPFCFITGSGHQYFLDTVRQLMEKVSVERIHSTLFKPWTYQDDKLSMRWDPLEDRRYALMDRDPTASDNKSRTVWMANLLAYRSMVLFPCSATRRGPGTTAWSRDNKRFVFTWPIWEGSLGPDGIRSILQLGELNVVDINRSALRERGILAAFRSERLQVGNPPLFKVNFSPARSIFTSSIWRSGQDRGED